MSALAGAVASAAGTGVSAVSRYRGIVPRNLTQFSTALPEGEVVRASFNKRVAISPNGTHIAFNPGDYLQRVIAAHASQAELVYGVLFVAGTDKRWESWGLPREPSSGCSWTR